MAREHLCKAKNPNIPCTPETCEWWINAPKFYNCFLVYRYYMQDKSHTLQEVANLLDISHTTVKQIETQAINKLRKAIEDGELQVEELKLILLSKG